MPEKGMVFILGKSGSGKSTLLNILAGFDKKTSGEVIFDGKSFDKFSAADFDHMRNQKIGFIFQDFCLMDQLDVRENVRLVLDLQRKKDCDVDALLKSVGLEGLETRLTKQLSAGQKQRVAIARALAKDPPTILADEPTGNIDSRTSKVVLDILKQLSREKLIVLVSHNSDDAFKYGDRIIELADGEIISDQTRVSDYDDSLKINLPDIVLPFRKTLDEAEIQTLNETVKKQKGKVQISQNTSGFVPSVQPEDTSVYVKTKRKNMSVRSVNKYAGVFLKKKKLVAALMVVVISGLMTLFGLSQVLTMVDGKKQVQNYIADNGDNGLILKKGQVNELTSTEYKVNVDYPKLFALTDEEIARVSDINGGNIMLQYPVMWSLAERTYNTEVLANVDVATLFKKLYATETNGVVQCDAGYLTRKFGKNGKLNVLAGNLEDAKTTSAVIITDYIADCYLFYKFGSATRFDSEGNDRYEAICVPGIQNSRIRICAVIETDYKDVLMPLVEQYFSGEEVDKVEVYNTMLYGWYHLCSTYSLNPDFLNAYVSEYFAENASGFARPCYADVTLGEGEGQKTAALTYGSYFYFRPTEGDNSLADNEVILTISMYNALFGTAYNKTISDEAFAEIKQQLIGQKFTMTSRLRDDLDPFFDQEFVVKDVVKTVDYVMIVSNNYKQLFKKENERPTAIYVENSDNVLDLYTLEPECYIGVRNEEYKVLKNIINIVNIFDDIFFYIAVALCVLIVGMLVFSAVGNVRGSAYEIGVMRAMGCKSSKIGAVFAEQLFVTGLAVSLLTFVASYFGMNLFNDILVSSIAENIQADGLESLRLLYFDAKIVGIDVGIVAVLTVLAALFPIAAVKKIKVINILKSRE